LDHPSERSELGRACAQFTLLYETFSQFTKIGIFWGMIFTLDDSSQRSIDSKESC
jgi:hypothetical protein